MIVKEYEFIQPKRSTPAGDAFWQMAEGNQRRAARLVKRLERFAANDTEDAFYVSAERKDRIEIFMVPQRHTLRGAPDAAALVRVDHKRRTIEIVHIFEEYGASGEQHQWEQARKIAKKALAGPQ